MCVIYVIIIRNGVASGIQYEQFCEVGKRFNSRLSELGGTCICPLGTGDDDAKYAVAL